MKCSVQLVSQYFGDVCGILCCLSTKLSRDWQNVTTSYSQKLLKYFCCELTTATTVSTTANTQASRAQKVVLVLVVVVGSEGPTNIKRTAVANRKCVKLLTNQVVTRVTRSAFAVLSVLPSCCVRSLLKEKFTPEWPFYFLYANKKFIQRQMLFTKISASNERFQITLRNLSSKVAPKCDKQWTPPSWSNLVAWRYLRDVKELNLACK